MDLVDSPTMVLNASKDRRRKKKKKNQDPNEAFKNRKKIHNRDKIEEMRIDQWEDENEGESTVKHQS